MKKYASIERRNNHYMIKCNYIANDGQRYYDEIVFEGSFGECHKYADEKRVILKTPECLQNMFRKGSINYRDIATLAC